MLLFQVFVYPGAGNVTSLMSRELLNSAGRQGLSVPPSEAEKRLGLGRGGLPASQLVGGGAGIEPGVS